MSHLSTQNKLSIKHWADDDKPREKLLLKGRNSLSDAELLAILIGSGSRNESAIELCKRILNQSNNNLNQLAKLTVKDLMKFKGIGEAKAISIVAALELGRRRKSEEVEERKSITCSKDAYEAIKANLQDLPHEEFWITLLNQANKVISTHLIRRGGTNQTTADIKIILKLALENLASAIILNHNHPSGNLKPSQADLQLTKKVTEATKLIDIRVLDHLIIGDNEYLSFGDEGLI